MSACGTGMWVVLDDLCLWVCSRYVLAQEGTKKEEGLFSSKIDNREFGELIFKKKKLLSTLLSLASSTWFLTINNQLSSLGEFSISMRMNSTGHKSLFTCIYTIF
jgi:hypothetical protein